MPTINEAQQQIQNLTNHATYRVVPINMPNIGNSARVTYIDPYLKEYSPLGWHANYEEKYTDTRGNNCIVIENSDGDDKFTAKNKTSYFTIDYSIQSPFMVDYMDGSCVFLKLPKIYLIFYDNL